jgi:hypothetical protein
MTDGNKLDTSGPAIVGMALALALLEHLRAKGVLTEIEANEVLETALSGLENTLPANDPGVQQARLLVEAMGRAASERRRTLRR